MICLLGVATLMVQIGCGMCAESNRRVAASPDHRNTAIVAVRDCGATTDWATQVRVSRRVFGISAGTSLVFVADTDHGATPATPSHAVPYRVEWLSNHHLRISYDRRATVVRQVPQVGDVTIEYVAGGA
jgi:hypothetical protein